MIIKIILVVGSILGNIKRSNDYSLLLIASHGYWNVLTIILFHNETHALRSNYYYMSYYMLYLLFCQAKICIWFNS